MQVELDRLNGEIEQKQEKIARIEHSIRLDRLEKEVVELEYISSLVDRFNKVKGEEQKLKILFEITARCDGLTQQIAEYNCELMWKIAEMCIKVREGKQEMKGFTDWKESLSGLQRN